MQQIITLVKKEFTLEFRNKANLNGVLLYILSTVFISYLTFKQITTPATWNALFWIIILFAGINAMAKSFMGESKGRNLYTYSIASPRNVIMAKLLYNMCFMLCIAFVGYAFFSLFIGNIVQNQPLFIFCLFLGSIGISGCLTFIAAISAKAGNNTGLMAVLSFPVLMPLLITIIKISKNGIDGIDFSLNLSYLLVLLLLNIIILLLSYLLFPYLWKE